MHYMQTTLVHNEVILKIMEYEKWKVTEDFSNIK